MDVVTKVIRILPYSQKKLEEKNYTKIIAFDETAVWFDAVGSTTVEKAGVEDVQAVKIYLHAKSRAFSLKNE